MSLTDEAKDACKAVWSGKASYVIIKGDAEGGYKDFVVEHKGEKGVSTEKFAEMLDLMEPCKHEGRLMVCNMEWQSKDDRKIRKTSMIGYAPADCTKEEKVALSSNLNSLRE